MTAKHLTTTRDRRSKRYAELHRQLERECARRKTKEPLSHLSGKQRKKFAASELYKMMGAE